MQWRVITSSSTWSTKTDSLPIAFTDINTYCINVCQLYRSFPSGEQLAIKKTDKQNYTIKMAGSSSYDCSVFAIGY